jgi:hypothetical protein
VCARCARAGPHRTLEYRHRSGGWAPSTSAQRF